MALHACTVESSEHHGLPHLNLEVKHNVGFMICRVKIFVLAIASLRRAVISRK